MSSSNQSAFLSSVELDIVDAMVRDALVSCRHRFIFFQNPECLIIVNFFELCLIELAHKVFPFSVSSLMDFLCVAWYLDTELAGCFDRHFVGSYHAGDFGVGV
jgi:hypothetical protein